MADLGLLMADPLAQACAEGRKTVTRRPMSPQPWLRFNLSRIDPSRHGWAWHRKGPNPDGSDRFGTHWFETDPKTHTQLPREGAPIPGAGTATVGRRVWVRECFASCGEDVAYRASLAPGWYPGNHLQPWRPSIHMPKWAARTWGTLTSVTPCDLSTVDDAEAQREGFDTAAEFLPAIREMYPDARWFWRLEIAWEVTRG